MRGLKRDMMNKIFVIKLIQINSELNEYKVDIKYRISICDNTQVIKIIQTPSAVRNKEGEADRDGEE